MKEINTLINTNEGLSVDNSNIDPRAILKADLGPEKYATLEKLFQNGQYSMPTDEEYLKIKNIKYELQREYSRDAEGAIILTEDEQNLLDKYDSKASNDIQELNEQLISHKLYDKLPTEFKEDYLNQMQSMVDEQYCNPDDPKNQAQSRGFNITTALTSAVIGAINPIAGIAYYETKNAIDSKNQCDSGLNVASKALYETGKAVASKTLPIVSSLAIDKIENSIQSSIDNKENQRREDVSNGLIQPTEQDIYRNFSNDILTFKKIVDNDKLEKASQEEIDNNLTNHSPMRDFGGRESIPIGELKLNSSHISLEKLDKLEALMNNPSTHHENNKRKSLSL